jgi:hypothetical protein
VLLLLVTGWLSRLSGSQSRVIRYFPAYPMSYATGGYHLSGGVIAMKGGFMPPGRAHIAKKGAGYCDV